MTPINWIDIDLDKGQPIVIVDDDPIVLQLLETILMRNGFRDIRKARDGQKALVILLNCDPCFIITDIDMPIMNGLQLIKQLRRKLRFNAVPIMALTSLSDKAVVITARKAGVDGYLIKSDIKEEEVLAKILETIDSRRARQ